MSSPSEESKKVLEAYKAKFKKTPTKADQLIQFAKKTKGMPTLSYKEANALVNVGKPKKKPVTTPGPKFHVGDEVVLTKDRTGIIRFYGKVHWKEEPMYGLEMTGGCAGDCDGSWEGKRYFVTEATKGKFFPAEKIRRKLTKTDHKRKASYNENKMKMDNIKKKFQGKDEETANAVPETTDVTATDDPVNDEETNDENNNVAGQTNQENDETNDNDNENETQKVEQNDDEEQQQQQDDDEEQQQETYQSNQNNNNDSEQEESQNDDKGLLPADAYENLLTFVMRQKTENKNLLLDIYCSPQLNPMLQHSFEQAQKMDNSHQKVIWPQLLSRWSKYL